MIGQCSNNLVLGGKREFEDRDLVEIRGTTSANAFALGGERSCAPCAGRRSEGGNMLGWKPSTINYSGC